MKDEKELQDIKDQLHKNQLDFAQQIFNTIDSLDDIKSDMFTDRTYTLENVMTYLANPEQNATALQDIMRLIKITNGMVREIITYKANILTYDHYIYTINPTKYNSKDKLVKAYTKCAKTLDMYNLKLMLPWMMEEIITNGELFLYVRRNNNGISIQKMPNKLCKIARVTNGVQKYAIQLSGITQKKLTFYPQEIQDLWTKYKAGSLKNDPNMLSGNYYILDSENAVAFSVSFMQPKTPPYYLGLIRNIAMLSDLQDIQNANTLLENFKLVVQKVPTDDEGNLLIEKDIVTMYHNALKKLLPSLVGGLTTPLEVENINLGGTSDNINKYIEQVENDVYNNSGVNSDIFNSASKTNTQIAVYGAIVDALLPKNLLRQIEVWLNYDMQNDSDTKNFKISFVDTTQFDKKDKIKDAINYLATWNSRLEVLAIMGHTPLDAINILYMEDILQLDELMPEKLTAYTASGNDTTNKDGSDGAPKNEDNDNTDLNEGEESDT